VRHYRSDIVLTPDGPDGSGTLITWAGTFEEKVPGTGRLMELVLTRMITSFARSVVRYAEDGTGSA
jgi:hypothetical protein